jgi:ATP-dependent DNA ligase
MLELDGRDLRHQPIGRDSLVFNECFQENSAIVYSEACKLGCEGIVSKRVGSEAEEDWR